MKQPCLSECGILTRRRWICVIVGLLAAWSGLPCRGQSIRQSLPTSQPGSRPDEPSFPFRGDADRTGLYRTKALLQLNGVLWEVSINENAEKCGIYSSPVLGRGLVYFTDDSACIFAIKPKTGREKWRSGRTHAKFLPVAPAIFGSVAVVQYGDKLAAWDADTGHKFWAINLRDFWELDLIGQPVLLDKTVYVVDDQQQVHTVNLGTGRATEDGFILVRWVDWAKEVAHAKQGYGMPTFTEKDIARATAVDAAVYKQVEWASQAGPNGTGRGLAAISRLGRMLLAPAIEGVTARDAPTGRMKWSFPFAKVAAERGRAAKALAVAHGLVFTSDDSGEFFALDVETGKVKWQAHVDAPVTSGPSVAEEIVYFGCADGHVHALDTATGREKWRFKASAAIHGPPAICDGIVYFGCIDGACYALH